MSSTARFKGRIEVHGPQAISGWCAPVPANDEEMPVELMVCWDDTVLRRIKPVTYREDTKINHGVGVTGFWFPIHENLNQLLPEGTLLTVRDPDGNAIPYINSDGVVPFGKSKDGGKQLQEKLSQGYVINKSGALGVPFSNQSPEQKHKYISSMQNAVKIFWEHLGLLLFPHYGSLLGLARNSKFIGHDDDVDMSFIVRCNNVDKVADIFYEVVDVLRQHGYDIKVINTGVLQIMPQEKNQRVVDVFISWVTDKNDFFTFFNVGGHIESPITYSWKNLEGVDFLVPEFYEDVLSFTFGKTWMNPDPLFQHVTPKHVKKIMDDLKAIERKGNP